MDIERLLHDAVFTRREWLKYGALLGTSAASAGAAGCAASAVPAAEGPGGEGAAAGGAAVSPESRGAEPARASAPLQRSPRRYDMKKSINLWALPYPGKMTLAQCFEVVGRSGFDAVEVNYNLEGDISPSAGENDLAAIRALAEKSGLAISGLCSFLFWSYPLTAGSEATRARGLELAQKMVEAARALGTENLLVVPGAVYVPWLEDSEEVPYKVCDERARAAIRTLIPLAEKHGVDLNIENIFFNAYLMSPPDLIEFVDSFQSPRVRIHFDTGNIMPLQFPEHWIPLLGKRIKNVHLKEYSKKSTDFSLAGFRPLLDGTTNWPAVMDALAAVDYKGYLTFEYFEPFQHYPEALIYQASDAMDRILGRG